MHTASRSIDGHRCLSNPLHIWGCDIEAPVNSALQITRIYRCFAMIADLLIQTSLWHNCDWLRVLKVKGRNHSSLTRWGRGKVSLSLHTQSAPTLCRSQINCKRRTCSQKVINQFVVLHRGICVCVWPLARRCLLSQLL